MGITKDEVIFHKDFEMLEEYLESMYPNRYEFKENELLIYYPEVTIKNLVGQTYNMYNIFIHYGYNTNIFAFTKLHYTISDYMNQTHNTFTHPHQSRGTIPFKSQSYCYGKLNIQYSFSNIESVIAVINVVDFWLHNENSSDCYTPIASLFNNEGEYPDINITPFSLLLTGKSFISPLNLPFLTSFDNTSINPFSNCFTVSAFKNDLISFLTIVSISFFSALERAIISLY